MKLAVLHILDALYTAPRLDSQPSVCFPRSSHTFSHSAMYGASTRSESLAACKHVSWLPVLPGPLLQQITSKLCCAYGVWGMGPGGEGGRLWVRTLSPHLAVCDTPFGGGQQSFCSKLRRQQHGRALHMHVPTCMLVATSTSKQPMQAVVTLQPGGRYYRTMLTQC